MSKPGKLYLIPIDIGGNVLDILTPHQKKVIQNTRHFVVEKTRTARRYISKLKLGIEIDQLEFFELDKHAKHQDYKECLDWLKSGKNVGVMSESGMPTIADPCFDIVSVMQKHKIEVKPMVGASALLLALMASGLNGQAFKFSGYLPINKEQRIKAINIISQEVKTSKTTQMFIETPYRNKHLFSDLLAHLSNNQRLCIALELTMNTEQVITNTVIEWKRQNPPDINKKMVVFLVGA